MAINVDNVTLIMMAAGDAMRFCKGDKPSSDKSDDSSAFLCKKQWLRLGLEPLWLVATRNITKHFNFKDVLITASKADFAYMQGISPYKVVQGGDTRAKSLQNALEAVNSEYVLVSDVARLNVPKAIVLELLESSKSAKYECIVPYINAVDTSIYDNKHLDRALLKLIQTPQLSKTSTLKQALKTNSNASDESSAIAALNKPIGFVNGSAKMSKITFKEDLLHHLHYLKKPKKCDFIGHGIDIHAFESGKDMYLGGVKLESSVGFKAHSDGDVALHALCDAILGAIGGGDIGEWFPDSNNAYKNADSKVLLKFIYDFARSVGYELKHADITIIAQIPKIAPYKQDMRKVIANILAIPLERINIKATTSEKLGFIGDKKGAKAEAVATLGFFPWHKHLHKEA